MNPLVTVLLVPVFVMPLAVSLVTYAFFWYEAANGDYGEVLRNRHGNRLLWVLLGGVCSAFISSIFSILTYPLGFLNSRSNGKRLGKDNAPHLILIHGLYHNSSAWIFLRRRLRLAGFHRVSCVNYWSLKEGFWELVDEIDQQIERLTDSEMEPLVLIGHSLGGLLARAWAGTRDSGKRTIGLITLGSPHKGSKLAVLGWGRLARSIRYKGRLMEEMKERLSHVDLPQYALYSPIDNMVLPAKALQPPGPGWTSMETAPISHVAMLYHKGTADLIVRSLREICRRDANVHRRSWGS
ncbi:MAG: alpha/beta fold hydrolase [Deltaproteobacteria bacterium]|nr:alpha/beta fold hydrolase [Deltaproteobacteria bacterium]